MSKTILYSYWRSSCSWRVRSALNLKKIPYETIPISLKEGAQKGTDYKKINPMGQIPALHIDGLTLIESLNIISYLEETRTQIPLLPGDPKKRTRVREISEIISSGIQPLQNIGVMEYMGGDRESQVRWAQHWIRRGFSALEKIMGGSSGRFCVGDEVTLADCCLMPQVFNARNNYKMDLGEFEVISRIERELGTVEAFKDAHPYNQPDCPRKTKRIDDL